MKRFVLYIGLLLILNACMPSSSSMALLDEDIVAIGVSESKGFGGMNEDIYHLIDRKEEIEAFVNVIKSTKKASDIHMNHVLPELDLLVEYSGVNGDLPTHGLHVIIGMEGERSILFYIGDDEAYETTVEETSTLRNLLLKD